MPTFALAEITVDCSDPQTVASFWQQLLGGELSVPMPGWFRLGPLTPGGPVLNFQPVPEPKTGKTRIHLDLWADDLDGAIAQIESLGGRDSGERHDYDEGSVVVMADPEGNEFCVCTACGSAC